MLLTVDVGNTSTHAGVFDDDRLVASFRFATEARASADALGLYLCGLLDLNGVDRRRVDGVSLATVVPPLRRRYEEMAERYFSSELHVLAAEDCGIPIDYEPPSSVGADRIANAVAAKARVGAPVIIVDFGTATTLDALDARGHYVGGAITLGPESTLAGLYGRTAQLPMVDLTEPSRAIGRSTQESIRSGVIHGLAGIIDGLVRRFRSELRAQAPTLATGGLAPMVVSACETVSDVVLDLTLQGIRMVYEARTR
ncbi:MAG: type III pantothenate kinase [Armatimonadia bacterium]|nr:type III pantothenate kinase [Armatimonadia bacterium]